MGSLEWLYVINVLYTAYMPYQLYRYYLYFDKYPIRMWNSLLMLICGLSIFLHQIFILLAQLIPTLNVWIAAVPLVITDSILTDSFILQALIVYFKFEIVNVQEKCDTQDRAKLDELDRLLRRARWVVSKRFGAMFMCGDVALITVLVMGYTSLHPDVGRVAANRCRDGRNPDCETLVKICMMKVALSWAIGLVIAFKLKTMVDSIGIKKNLQRIALTYLVTNLAFTLVAQMVPIIDGYMFSTTQLMFGYHLMFYFGIEKQIRLAERVVVVSDDNKSLLHLFLQNPHYFAIILKHAKSEFNAENLLFWKDVQAVISGEKTRRSVTLSASRRFLLKATDSEAGARTDYQKDAVLSIYNKYIADGAMFQINLPSRIIHQIQKDIAIVQMDSPEKPADPSKIYLAALKTIETLMNDDMLPRFQKTAAGKKAWAEFEMNLKEATPRADVSLDIEKGSSTILAMASSHVIS